MSEFLNRLGEDLATRVRSQALPTTELDVESPQIEGAEIRFFDFLLQRLAGQMNSVFLVGQDLDYVNAYINSLALLMDNPTEFEQVIRFRRARIEHTHATGLTNRMLYRLVGRRLFTFKTRTFLSLAENMNTGKWHDIFQQLVTETREKQYILVPDDIGSIFLKAGRGHFDSVALGLFFATRGMARLSIVAPLDWPNYASNIERGRTPAVIRHWQPFLLDPRPQSLPPTPFERLAPDPRYKFVQ
jgi:hypothetical protein